MNRELYTSNHFYVHIKRCRSQEKPFEIAAQQYLELPYDIKIPIRIANEFLILEKISKGKNSKEQRKINER